MLLFKSNVFTRVYDNPEGEKPPEGEVDLKKESFTQEEVNKILANERRKLENKTKEQINQLEELKKNTALTQAEKDKLSQRIEALSSEFQTKEQQKANEIEKLQQKYNADTKVLNEQVQTWQTRHNQMLINNGILGAAAEEKAFSPEQINDLLSPKARVIDQLDANGQPTGKLVVKIKFDDKDKDGNPVTLELTPSETLKRMKELPERYGNLFGSPSKSGLGREGGGPTDPVDISKMTTAQYIEYRKTRKMQ